MNRMYFKDSTELLPENRQPYKAVNCLVPTKLALRFDVGVAGYYYRGETKDWLGDFYGPNFGMSLSYNKISLGARFKPWTLNPRKELSFNDTNLPLTAKLNPIKIDY